MPSQFGKENELSPVHPCVLCVGLQILRLNTELATTTPLAVGHTRDQPLIILLTGAFPATTMEDNAKQNSPGRLTRQLRQFPKCVGKCTTE